MKKETIQELKDKHEKLRNILIEYGCEENGDCIIDEICLLFKYPQTIVYYEENE
jgi:hypothetical protein